MSSSVLTGTDPEPCPCASHFKLDGCRGSQSCGAHLPVGNSQCWENHLEEIPSQVTSPRPWACLCHHQMPQGCCQSQTPAIRLHNPTVCDIPVAPQVRPLPPLPTQGCGSPHLRLEQQRGCRACRCNRNEAHPPPPRALAMLQRMRGDVAGGGSQGGLGKLCRVKVGNTAVPSLLLLLSASPLLPGKADQASRTRGIAGRPAAGPCGLGDLEAHLPTSACSSPPGGKREPHPTPPWPRMHWDIMFRGVT